MSHKNNNKHISYTGISLTFTYCDRDKEKKQEEHERDELRAFPHRSLEQESLLSQGVSSAQGDI